MKHAGDVFCVRPGRQNGSKNGCLREGSQRMCWAHVGGPVFGRRASELVHVKVRAPGLVLADRHAVLRSTHMKGGVEAAARDFGTRSFAQLVAWRRHKTDPLPCRACVALVPGMPAGRRGDGGRGGYVTNENVPSSRLPWRLQRPSCVDKVVVRAGLYPSALCGLCAEKKLLSLRVGAGGSP
jgi:hypothetical protein